QLFINSETLRSKSSTKKFSANRSSREEAKLDGVVVSSYVDVTEIPVPVELPASWFSFSRYLSVVPFIPTPTFVSRSLLELALVSSFTDIDWTSSFGGNCESWERSARTVSSSK